MRIKKLSAVMAVTATAALLAFSACNKKVAPKPSNEPGLRENKANMMESLDKATEDEFE